MSSNAGAFALYHYTPSMGAAITFTLLFILTTSFHAFQMFRSRTWFLIPFVLGGICRSPNTPTTHYVVPTIIKLTWF